MMKLFSVPGLAVALVWLAGCGGTKSSFEVVSVVNYSNPATAIFPGGEAIITLDAAGGEYPTTASAYTVYFRDPVDGVYDPDTMEGGRPTLGTMFTDNGDGTFEIVVTIPVNTCAGPMVVVTEDYAAPPYTVPLPTCM